MPARITRDDEGINLYFTDYGNRYEVSEEIAYDFIVDYDRDDYVIGLEILWNESKRAGMAEGPVLAFGILGAALAELSWRYQADIADTGRAVEDALCQRLEKIVAALGLGFRVYRGQPDALFDLAILDAGDNLLVAVDLKMGIFRQDKAQQHIKILKETVVPTHPGAIGVCVFIDLARQGRPCPPVKPGRWVDWSQGKLSGGGRVWAHIAIIPPAGCEYPWLPKGFLPSRYEAKVGT